MAIDRERIQRNADKLVRQNKMLEAVQQYSLLLKDNPNDLVTINKIGDLLARAGRPSEAVRHFQKIAEVYTQGGFFLKAIAIYKKILKLDPRVTEASLRLGDLYARQDLLKEAREMYFHAARRFFERREVPRARDVYERLLRLEPDRPETRIAFAEMLQSVGDHVRATTELASAASLIAAQGRTEESLALYKQAFGSAMKEPAAAVTVVRGVLKSAGGAAAVPLAEQLHRQFAGQAEIVDVLIESYLAAGRNAEAERAALEAHSRVKDPGPASLSVLGRLHARQGRAAEAGQAAAQAADELAARGRGPEASALLEEFIGLLPGSVPLLMRRVEMARAASDRPATVAALEKLARAYSAAGMKERASQTYEQLSTLGPEGEALGEVAAAAEPRAPAGPPAAGPAAAARKVTGPLTPDQEFLSEHLAEADVFARYGLVDKAIEQLQAVVERLPSNLEARRRLRDLYLDRGQRASAVEEGLAIARQLATGGRTEQAIAELREALKVDPSNQRATDMIESLRDELEVEAVPRRDVVETEITLDETASVAETSSEGLLDLSSDIAESLAKALEDAVPPEAPEESTHSFDEVLQLFREKIKEEVEAEDFGTHYDLGIAYKEMGLYDEAINEFEYASQDRARFLDCCSMIALCHREKGDGRTAESWYRRALSEAVEEQSVERRIGLIYDLGELLAVQGDWASARDAFEQVFQGNQDYRDVREKLREARERAV